MGLLPFAFRVPVPLRFGSGIGMAKGKGKGRKKKVVGSGVGCVFQKALSAFGYSFMCNGIAAKLDKELQNP